MMGPCRGTYAVYQFPFGESKLSAFNDQFGWWDWYNRVIKVTFSNSLLRKRTLPPAFPWNSAVLWSLHNCDSFEDLPMCSGIYHCHGLWWKANRNSQEWGMVGNCSWFASNITAAASIFNHLLNNPSQDPGSSAWILLMIVPFSFNRDRFMRLEEH